MLVKVTPLGEAAVWGAMSSLQKLPRIVGGSNKPTTFDRLERGIQSNEQLSMSREVASFVRVHFADSADSSSLPVEVSSKTLPEVGKDGVKMVWVENARTGLMVPVFLSGSEDASHRRGADSGVEDEERPSLEDEAALLVPPSPLRNDGWSKHASLSFTGEFELNTGNNLAGSSAALLARVVFFLCQGLFAGFAFSTALAQQSSSTDAKFLLDYEPLSSEYRRLFYLLSSLSAVGSFDTFMTTVSKTNRPNLVVGHRFSTPVQSRESQGSVSVAAAAAVLHFVAFALSVIMSAFDVLISVKNGSSGIDASSGNWATSASKQDSFASSLSSWFQLDTGRLVCSLLAWLMCCLLIWRDLLAIESRSRELIRLKDVLTAWKERTSQLQGEVGIDSLDAQSLKKLIALQAMGYERASAALRVQEDFL